MRTRSRKFDKGYIEAVFTAENHTEAQLERFYDLFIYLMKGMACLNARTAEFNSSDYALSDAKSDTLDFTINIRVSYANELNAEQWIGTFTRGDTLIELLGSLEAPATPCKYH